MGAEVSRFEIAYSDAGDAVLRRIGEEVYGEYIGQQGWMTTEEYRRFIARLAPQPDSHILEIGAGTGGCAVYLAATTESRVTGLEIVESGVRRGEALAKAKGLENRVAFRCADAARPLPFGDDSFDAVFSNDSFHHLADRLSLFRQCHRVLHTGGRLLFTDPMVLAGIVSSDEIRQRSWGPPACLVPHGENERLLQLAGFEIMSWDDLTEDVVVVARRQAAAFEKHRNELIQLFGAEGYQGLVNYTAMAGTLADQKRLMRVAYLSRKAASR
ncbi:MAG TPA: methyltransferase domain-containing protein [Candidatus Acidoferrales bacterium]|nr:methyltransferase domain-containing protein [Candidatus Acidoferrales bacterium]